MRTLNLAEIAKAVQGQIVQGKAELQIQGVSIDSRTIKPGELFLAIIGERFDGHQFIQDAVAKGARAVLVDREISLPTEIGVIQSRDTTEALQKLASYYRQQFPSLKVIAVTGSAGKTSTKDMTAALLSKKYKVKKTEGNLNNYYGLPLTILSLEGNEDLAVLELGMSKLGEIEQLAAIALPEIGIITNVGPTHLESLGSVENVARGKAELISSLPEHGLAVLNYDNRYVREMAAQFKGRKIIYYGLNKAADLYAEAMAVDPNTGMSRFLLHHQGEKRELALNQAGEHNLYNALAAIAVARELGVNWQQIEEALQRIRLSSLRWEIKKSRQGVTVINDTYNANPLSMQAALKAAREQASGRLIAVLGGMLELGLQEEREHLKLGEYLLPYVDKLITVGKLGSLIARGAISAGMSAESVWQAVNNKEASCFLKQNLQRGDTVLVKGSRGIKMEEIVAELFT